MNTNYGLLGCFFFSSCISAATYELSEQLYNSFPNWSEQDLISLFAEQKISSQNGGPLRKINENWIAAKNTYQSNSAWKNWFSSRKSQVDTWIAGEPDKAEWIAGWALDYINKDGSNRAWSLDDPIINDTNNSKLKGGWVYYFRMKNVNYIQESARMFRLLDDSTYSSWAKNTLFFYAQMYSQWPLQTWNGRARMFTQSLDEAVAVTILIDAVRLLGDELSSTEREYLFENLFLPIADNLKSSYQGVNNISLWQASAIAMIGMEFSDDDLVNFGLSSDKGIRAILSSGVTHEMFWKELSFGYQNYVIRALLPLFNYAALSGYDELIYKERLGAQDLLLSPAQLRFDNGILPSPNDVVGDLTVPDSGIALESYRSLPTMTGIKQALNKYNWDVLLDPPTASDLPTSNLPVIKSMNASESQFGILKNSTWQAFIKYGQVVVNHSHPDSGHFDLYWKNIPITKDPGTVSYGAALHSEYFSTAVAHNSVIINGQTQNKPIIALVNNFDDNHLSISFPFTKNIKVTKTFDVQDDVLITTSIQSNDGSSLNNISHILNLNCSLGAVADIKSNSYPLPTLSAFKYWDVQASFDYSGNISLPINCSNESFTLSLNSQESGQIILASVPSTPVPQRRLGLFVNIPTSSHFHNITMKFHHNE